MGWDGVAMTGEALAKHKVVGSIPITAPRAAPVYETIRRE
jgi:hypothetical protein